MLYNLKATARLSIAAICLLGAGSQAFALEGNAEAGAKVFKKCRACHNADKPKNKIAPYLMGVVGRPVATVEGYKYSKAMVAFGDGGKVWDEKLLAKYLAHPRAIVKGTKMAFAGLRNEQDIADVIAYLKSHPAE